MATSTWTFSPAPGGFQVTRDCDQVVNDLGDGIYRDGIKSVAWTHQDGTGGASVAYRGYATFRITLPAKVYGASFTDPLDFLQARRDAGNEAFYIYDPLVTPAVASWDGVTTAGRHLVKWFGKMEYTGRSYQIANFATFEFKEVQS